MLRVLLSATVSAICIATFSPVARYATLGNVSYDLSLFHVPFEISILGQSNILDPQWNAQCCNASCRVNEGLLVLWL